MLEHFSNPVRCQCKNVNKLTCKNRQKVFLNINKIRTCNFHIKTLYINKIIKIQKIYKGFRARKKLNNIYKNLPNDLQYLIKYFMNIHLYEKRKEDKIKIIINRNISSFNIEMINLFNFNSIYLDQFLKYEDFILNNYYKFSKYNNYINKDIKTNFYKIDFIINNYVNHIKYFNDYNSDNTNEIFKQKLKLKLISTIINYYYSINFDLENESDC